MGKQVAGQSYVRILSGWETRYPYLGGIDPIASGLDCQVCMDLCSLVELVSGFLREQMRGFHDLLRQKPISLFMLLGWCSISVASLTMRSMYWVLVARMEVL
jgi:hypothetical protein